MGRASMKRRRFVDVLLPILRPAVALILKCLVNQRVVKAPPKGLKAPYLILSSHITDFDVFLLMMHVDSFPVAVVHELLVRNPYLRMALMLFGTIIKRSGVPEAMCIRQMKRAVSSGRSVLIYPQGDVIWAGSNEPLKMEIAKLARYLGVPVLVMRQDGAYTTYPRWANGVRRGRIDIRYEVAVEKGDFESNDDAALLSRMSAAFDHDERSWLKGGEGAGVRFISTAPARGLQRLLFLCPGCGTFGHMSGMGNTISCLSCGSHAIVSPRLSLEGQAQGLGDIWQWHEWQSRVWRDRVSEGFPEGNFKITEGNLEAKSIAVPKVSSTGGNLGFARRIWKPGVPLPVQTAVLTPGGFRLEGDDGSAIREVGFDDIEMVYVASFYRPNLLIVKTREEYLRIRFRRHSNPAYAWSLAIKQMVALSEAK